MQLETKESDMESVWNKTQAMMSQEYSRVVHGGKTIAKQPIFKQLKTEINQRLMPDTLQMDFKYKTRFPKTFWMFMQRQQNKLWRQPFPFWVSDISM